MIAFLINLSFPGRKKKIIWKMLSNYICVPALCVTVPITIFKQCRKWDLFYISHHCKILILKPDMTGKKADLPAGRRRHGSSTRMGSMHWPALQVLCFCVPEIPILPSAKARKQAATEGRLIIDSVFPGCTNADIHVVFVPAEVFFLKLQRLCSSGMEQLHWSQRAW